MSARLELTSSAEHVARAVRDLEDYSQQRGFSPQRSRAVRLVAEEILANIIEHGRCLRADEPILVLVHDEPDELRLVIIDAADPFDPTACSAEASCRASGGMGLALVRRLVDGFDYTRADGRNRVTAVFAKRAPDEPPATEGPRPHG